MTDANYPSPIIAHRRADMIVHMVGLVMILVASGLLISRAIALLPMSMVLASLIYLLCALASNLASCAYHFAPWPAKRTMLRRIDHAAIYPSITGTFTPFFVQAGTNWTMFLLCLCWALTLVAMWNKITNPTIKSRWSTASYLTLGGLGLCALPDLTNVPVSTLWCIVAGAAAYVIGTVFYSRKQTPFRYPIWHSFVNIGALFMFLGVWQALFQ